MLRPLAFGSLILVAALAGCVEPTPEDSLRDIYGKQNVQKIGDATVVLAQALEGRVVTAGGNATWGNMSATTLMVPKLTLTKSDPGAQGGGGTEQGIDLSAVNATIEVRFANADRLAGYQAKYAVTNELVAGQAPNWSAGQTAGATFSIPVTQAGNVYVLGQLSKGGAVAGIIGVPFIASVSAEWTIESAVFPVRPGGAGPAPANYEKMADFFFMDLGGNGTLEAITKYRGMYTPPSGTDVDLGVIGPDINLCDGSGGPATPVIGSTQPDPSQSAEEITVEEIEGGAWTVRVGSQKNGCTGPNGPQSGFQYNNSGMVPYTLTVKATYKIA